MSRPSEVFTASDYHRLPELDRRRFRAWCKRALAGTDIRVDDVSSVILWDKNQVAFDIVDPLLRFKTVIVTCTEPPPVWRGRLP